MPRTRSGQGRGRGRGSSVGAVPTPRGGRGSSVGAVPTPRRGRGSSVDDVPTHRRHGDRSRSLHDYGPRPGPSPAVRFDVPAAGGQEVSFVDVHGERTSISVAQGVDGRYSTESVRGRFESIDQLMNALDASWPQCPSLFEDEKHVGISASAAQTPHSGGLGFRGLPCKEQHVVEPASAQTLHKLDALSMKDRCYDTTMEGLSTTAASLPSPHDIIDVSPPSRRCLSSSPIWKRRDFEWAITFYTIEDTGGYFHTFPHVGGPFQSKDEANKAIDRYLTDRRDLTMGMGLSEVDKLVQECRFFPDGTKKRLKVGQSLDKRHDSTYQLVQAVLYKYNDHHNLFWDRAYEVINVLDEPSMWEEENSRMCMHMNFTAKTKSSDGFLFFAEVTHVFGVATVNCCCIVKSTDNGPCFGCRTCLKHPTDCNAYTGGQRNVPYGLPFGSRPVKASWCIDEDSDEEVERLRTLFRGSSSHRPCTA